MRIKDNGTSRTLTWNSVYDDGFGMALPATTTAGKTHYLGFMYNSASNKRDLIDYTEEAESMAVTGIITIDNTKVSADLTDFPVYVDLSDMPSAWRDVVTN